MGQHTGAPVINPEWLRQIITDTITTMMSTHPGCGADLVVRTVEDAALELACALSDLAALPLLLHRRANARLLAIAGRPVVIASSATAVRAN